MATPMQQAAEAFQRGVRHHQAGQLQQAELLYRQALAIDPRHAPSLHLLAVVALQVGRADAALAHVDEALRLQPNVPEYHHERGNALRGLGRLADAEAAYRNALRLRGRFPEALCSLGTVLLMAGRFADAESCGRKAVRLKPESWEAQTLLGHALGGLGRFQDAEACHRAAVRLMPGVAVIHNNLGYALSRLGRHAEAEPCYREAVRLAPNFADAHNNLGGCLKDLNRPAEAEPCFREGLRLRPDDAGALSNLADALSMLERHDEAELCCRAALKINPDFATAHNTLGSVLRALGRLPEAEMACRTALRLQPDFALAHNNLGVALLDLRRTAEAVGCFQEALNAKADFPEACVNLAGALTKLGQFDSAEAYLNKALQLRPGFVEAQIKLGRPLLVQHRFGELISLYRQVIGTSLNSVPAWRDLLSVLPYTPDLDADQFAEFHRQFGRAVAHIATKSPLTNDRNPDRRLRVGWLSSDFNDHPVGRNVELLFAHRDPAAFEMVCYADIRMPTPRTDWFRAHADAWRSISGMSDAAVADKIRADRVDVMIYLAGRFDQNRPQIAAWRPAPVQVSFHDVATSGIADMDYLVADSVLVPRNGAEYFTERVLRLPNFYLHAPLPDDPAPTDPPCVAARHVTFGSFHNPIKLNPKVLELWAGVLQRIPNARLRLKYLEAFASEEARNGIRRLIGPDHADRLDFDPFKAPIGQHLAQYNQVDIALDPFPFNGSTASFEALWMGVPIVTLAGDRMAGRWTASILNKVDLGDLVARSPDHYIEIAAALAADTRRLLDLRQNLRERVRHSSLCNGPRNTRHLERALRAVWRKWCGTASAAGPVAAGED